jgi:hypothetical protein
MTAESPLPRSSDQLVRVCQTLPPIEVDCSDWVCETEPYTSTSLERVCQTLPPIEAEFFPPSDVFLELTFTLAANADANRILDKATKLFERVDEYEKSLGGAGITWDRERSNTQNGTLSLILMPNNPADAEQYLQTLATLVVGALAEFQAVNAVLARGCRATEPNRPLFEINEVAA